MTHDELLAKIDAEGEFLVQHFDCKPVFISALRAVVELHEPSPKDYKNEIGCVGCDINSEWATWNEEYPCPTIQAIEKELGHALMVGNLPPPRLPDGHQPTTTEIRRSH